MAEWYSVSMTWLLHPLICWYANEGEFVCTEMLTNIFAFAAIMAANIIRLLYLFLFHFIK